MLSRWWCMAGTSAKSKACSVVAPNPSSCMSMGTCCTDPSLSHEAYSMAQSAERRLNITDICDQGWKAMNTALQDRISC